MRFFLLLLVTFSLLTGCNSSAMKATLPTYDHFLIFAHRGASGYAPENTMASFKLANELGADYIEIDLQMTKDGHLVALHDDSVDRTTNGKGKVFLYTLEELKQLDAGSWFNEKFPKRAKVEYEGLTIPTLREIFEEFGHNVNYYIEMKNPEQYKQMEKTLVLLLEEFGFLEENESDGKVIISSFSERSLRIMYALEPSLPLVKLQTSYEVKKSTKRTFNKISKYAVAVGPSYKFVNENYVKNAMETGLQVHPYTVDDPYAIDHLEEWGVTGIFTNYIDIYERNVHFLTECVYSLKPFKNEVVFFCVGSSRRYDVTLAIYIHTKTYS
ncbi:glycerophosphodiester phosphodiesterase [Pallidibacillus thermolactis]|uniref:glycerophosphodiester phosphodiesterase n=1 Tax=Pallidibacillus thermolactis TaxID=251051 RepID=UPI002E1EDA5D|nr:glycerophosphodiester phosphodiesterase [Pallidibacillus thermolactis subsp. kokeshiiformis]